MKTLKFSPPNLRELLVKNWGKKALWGLEKLIARYSLVPNTPFLASAQFPWASILEQNWQGIREELDLVLQYENELPRFQDISPDQANSISRDNLWKTFFLYGYGVKMEQNCNYCPQTTQTIEQIPGMKTAFFSIMLPGKHIPEHRGPYNGVLRCHLPLKVPDARKKCGIRVDQEIRHWEEGKTIVFDDSYPHEAWNKTEQIRVVLFLDIMRPLRFPGSWLNHLLISLIRWSPFIRDAKKNQQQWDRKIAQVFKS
ncbi:MAG: aspartyl/asparaginyl beta-hydroxylase domain-containing protein [Cyanobacteria bacterium P01_C01_bin.72]